MNFEINIATLFQHRQTLNDKSGTDLTQTVKMNELFSPTALASQVLLPG